MKQTLYKGEIIQKGLHLGRYRGDKWSWDSTNVLYVIKNRLKFSDKKLKMLQLDLVIVTTKTSVKECSNKMRQKKIEQVPVINVEGELVGLVRTTDLIKALSD